MPRKVDNRTALRDVDWTGAAILSGDNLTGRQDRVLGGILLRIYEVADIEAQFGGGEPDRKAYIEGQQFRRPRHVFFIDGARGSGKTSMLLTLRDYLKCLGDEAKWRSKKWEGQVGYLKQHRKKLHAQIEAKQKDLKIARDANPALESNRIDPERDQQILETAKALFEKAHHGHEPDANGRITACVLPLLVPSDLEHTQSVMEGIFALMSAKLKDDVRHSNEPHDDTDRGKDRKRLLEALRGQVAKGWYLARSERDETIRTYSASLDSFLNKLGETGTESYNRVQTWRTYVNDFLDHMKSQLLVVFIDDTDVSPSTTTDILHTTRIFLDHPRIVTIIAGHLRSMRQSLIWRQLSELKDPVEVSAEPSGGTPTTWRRLVRHQVEEYLEKVLPRPLRFFLSFESVKDIADVREYRGAQSEDKTPSAAGDGAAADAQGRGDADDDFKKIVRMPFDDYCRQRLSDFRDDFLRVKVSAYHNRRRGLRELASEEDKDKLERFLAWWLFRHRYGEQLRPRSIRQLRTLAGLTGADSTSRLVSRHLPHVSPKRLAVILFEAPENNLLIDRFNDADTRVNSWLLQQRVDSCWRGERYFKIDERLLQKGTYGHSLIAYRIDLGLTLPIRENDDADIPLGLLPRPSGQNMIGMNPFYREMPPQTLFGVAKHIQHSVLPSNCIYFNDLDCLPDIAFEPGPRETTAGNPLQFSEDWNTNLIYRWPELFFFDVDRLSAAEKPDPKERKVVGPTDQELATYIKDIVLPLGSLEVGRFAPSPAPPTTKSFELLADIETADQFGRGADRIDSLRRHYDYYNHLAETQLGRAAAQQLAKDTVAGWNEFVSRALHLDPAQDKDIRDDIADSFESYQALINDMRRAWHASRILLFQIPAKRVSEDGARAEKRTQVTPPFERRQNFRENSRYTIPRLASIKRWIEQNEYSRVVYKRLAKDPIEGLDAAMKDALNELNEAPDEGKRSKFPLWDKVPPQHLVGDAAMLSKGRWNSVEAFKKAFPKSLEDCKALAKPPEKPGRLVQYDPCRHETDVHQARYAETVFLYLWALAPCLPALVHLEYGAVCHATRLGRAKDGVRTPPPIESTNAQTTRESQLKGVVGKWREFLWELGRYYLRYRASLELTLARLELIHPWHPPSLGDKEKDASPPRVSLVHGVSYSMIPDISFTSMGVSGAVGLAESIGRLRKDRDGFLKKQKEGTLAKGAVEPVVPDWADNFREASERIGGEAFSGRELKSVFEDFEEKLLVTAKFLNELERKAPGHAKALFDNKNDLLPERHNPARSKADQDDDAS